MTLERFDPAGLNPVTDSWINVVRDVSTLATQICASDFVPAALRPRNSDDWTNAAARVAAIILHGREVGLPPMTALASTHIIEGRPALSAEGMRGLVFAAGHEIALVEATSARCVVRGRRRGQVEAAEVTWTIEDARRAGLLSGQRQNWTKYPRQMLLARATAELCRAVFPDVIHGLAAVEELQDEPAGDAVEEPPASRVERPTVTRTPRPVTAPAAAEPGQEQASAAESASVPTPDVSTPENGAQAARAPRPRARPSIPRRGGPQPVAPESEPGAAVDSGEAVDRPAAEDSPRPATPPEDPATQDAAPTSERSGTEPPADPVEVPPAAPPISHSQRASIMAHWTRLQVQDRNERLQATARLVGRPIESTNQLTLDEGLALLDTLAHLRDRDQLDARLTNDPLDLEGDHA